MVVVTPPGECTPRRGEYLYRTSDGRIWEILAVEIRHPRRKGDAVGLLLLDDPPEPGTDVEIMVSVHRG